MPQSKKILHKPQFTTQKVNSSPSTISGNYTSKYSHYGYYKKARVIPKAVELKGDISPNLSLLSDLVDHQSPSCSKELSSFIEWLVEYLYTNIEGVYVDIDDEGNVFVIKGQSEAYPCIVAHTDVNQDLHDSITLLRKDDILFGWDHKNAKQVGCGFDDKVGILIALQALKHFDTLKVFFPINEEVGYIGSSKVDMKWFDDVAYCIQPDRNSYNTDFITYTNGVDVCSKEFTNTCMYLMQKYGYAEASGLGTDIGELKDRGLECSAINVSCGYFREHTNAEVCSVSALHNCLNFIFEVIEFLGETKFEHIIEYKRSYYDDYPINPAEWDKYMNEKYGYSQEEPSDLGFSEWYDEIEAEGTYVNYEWKSDQFVLSSKDHKFLEEDFCPLCIAELDKKQAWQHCKVCNAYYWKVYDELDGEHNNQSNKAKKRKR